MRAEQAELETPPHSARALAAKLRITFATLDVRAVTLFGRGNEDGHSIVSDLISLGLSARYGTHYPERRQPRFRQIDGPHPLPAPAMWGRSVRGRYGDG